MSVPIEVFVAWIVEVAGAAVAAGVAGATSGSRVQMSWMGDAKAPGAVGRIVMVEASDRLGHSTWIGQWAGRRTAGDLEHRAVATE